MAAQHLLPPTPLFHPTDSRFSSNDDENTRTIEINERAPLYDVVIAMITTM